MRKVDHVGIAVADLDEARRTWDALLGQTPVVEDVPTQKVRTATYPCGIELVAPQSPESPISRFLAKRGPGIHHVTLAVDDIAGELARLKSQGVKLVNEAPVKGAGGLPVAFLQPVGGVLVELKEKRR
ncbi:MAG: VOC family protein [Planctomycetes bacterium]|nr:VOC family protein [Planctomycetota bacterium]